MAAFRVTASHVLAVCVGSALLYPCAAIGAMYKCVSAEGKTTYQDTPCPSSSSEAAVKIVPAPSNPSAPTKPPIYVAPVPRSMYESAANPKIPNTTDAKGALETWDRFGKAINRGDKDAALRELTPSAQQKYAPVFDTLLPAPGGAAPQK